MSNLIESPLVVYEKIYRSSWCCRLIMSSVGVRPALNPVSSSAMIYVAWSCSLLKMTFSLTLLGCLMKLTRTCLVYVYYSTDVSQSLAKLQWSQALYVCKRMSFMCSIFSCQLFNVFSWWFVVVCNQDSKSRRTWLFLWFVSINHNFTYCWIKARHANENIYANVNCKDFCET